MMEMFQARMVKRARLGPGGTTMREMDQRESTRLKVSAIARWTALRAKVERRGLSGQDRKGLVAAFPELAGATKAEFQSRAIELIAAAIAAIRVAHRERMEKLEGKRIKAKQERAGRAALAPQRAADKKAKRKAADERRKLRRESRKSHAAAIIESEREKRARENG